MKQKKHLWKSTATLLIALTIVLSGCGGNANNPVPVPTTTPENVTNEDDSIDDNSDINTDINQEEISPEDKLPGSPEATTTPELEATEKPDATTKPEATLKPTAKPTEKPAATPKPTAKPTAKPTPKPTAKPTAKPVATPKPTAKPTATPEQPTSINLNDISEQIINDVQFSSMMDVSGEMISDVFYMDSDKYVEDGIFQVAMMNVKAADLAIIKLKNESDYDAVKTALTKRAEDVQASFEKYLQDQYENAKNYQIVRHGKYVLYSISHDQKKVLEIFESYVK
ncbi:MAG TPA: DUF4358 domain-containing protein [Candidatus Paenibacillus intestinavium]|nr:DUF4358 domain-containing protein [Candidatus Paenibacillus intestinavium]